MEKVESEDDKVVVPSQKHYADFEPSPVPVAPDGGIAPGFGLEPPAPIPELTPETCVCLRGPCRHYWHLVTSFDAGNPESTWEELGIRAPRQHSHVCLLNPGMETDFTGDCVFECNRWDPMLQRDLVQLETRRRTYRNLAAKAATAAPAIDDQLEEPIEQLDEGDDDAGDADNAT